MCTNVHSDFYIVKVHILTRIRFLAIHSAMKTNHIFKISVIIFTGLFLTSCSQLFGPNDTTSIDVTVVNNGTQNISSYALAKQNYDASKCQPDYASQSNTVVINPGQSNRVSTSIKCYGHVRTYVTVEKQTEYNVGVVVIRDPNIASKLTPGVQFRITGEDRLVGITIQMGNIKPAKPANYENYWSLAPDNLTRVAWLEHYDNLDGRPSDILHISVPKEWSSLIKYIEFDKNMGISDFGHYGEPVLTDGVYRAELNIVENPSITVGQSSGSLICDDIGCNVK